MEDLKITKLFSGFKIKKVSLKNRIVFLPHYHGLSSIEGLPTQVEIDYYVERAKGGAGLIVVGGHAVSQSGQMHRTFIDASKRESVQTFKKMVNEVHRNNSKIFCQLTHAGPTKMCRVTSDLWSPSQIIEENSRKYTMGMSKVEIKDLITSFRESSQNVIESGFDGIEIKVAHDGLLRAFISPFSNKRSDEYGGSFTNMTRILVEIFSTIKEINKGGIPLGVRLCMDEFKDEGYKLEYAVEIVKYLVSKNLIDYVNTDAGTGFIIPIPPMSIPLGFAEYMAAAIKKEVNIPVIAYGRINDPLQAEQILQNESADLIGMARQLVCDPETPNKAKKGDFGDIRRCIGCLDGCLGEVHRLQPISCIQNLAVGKEREFGIGTLKKAKVLKKIVIVGGGIAGLKAAEICGKRGHKVILFEKNDYFGGQLNLVKQIPFRVEFKEVVRYLEYQVKNNKNIDIRRGNVANKELILNESPDVVIVATGANPHIPKYLQSDKTFTSWDILSEKVEPKGHVIIYDKFGQNEGIGVAEYILDHNDSVSISFYTPVNFAGQDINIGNISFLYRKLFPKSFNVYPHYNITSLTKNCSIEFTKLFTDEKIIEDDYDMIVLIGDKISNESLFKELEDQVDELYRVGDARAPSIVDIAINRTEEIVRNI